MGWRTLADEAGAELVAWRAAHPWATLVEIEAAVQEALARLQGHCLTDLLQSGAAVVHHGRWAADPLPTVASAPLPPVAPPDDASLPTTAPQPIAPLAVSGLVITKSDLIEALRLYFPGLTDLSTIDAERYLLHLTPATPAAEPRQEARHG